MYNCLVKLLSGASSTSRRVLLLAVTAFSATSQQRIPAPSLDASRHFEVASIKPSQPDAAIQDMRISFPANRLDATNITLIEFFGFAYPHPGQKYRAGPDWVNSDRFDIAATADAAGGEATGPQRLEMMRTLLQDRFKLAYHLEQTEVQGLALAAAKAPPGLEPTKDGEQTGVRYDQGKTVFQNSTVGALAFTLSNMLGMPVADRTGITGRFDFTLDPNRFVTLQPATSQTQEPVLRGSYADRVRLAVEGLGFRLETEKASAFTVVIDHVERPGEN